MLFYLAYRPLTFGDVEGHSEGHKKIFFLQSLIKLYILVG